MTSSIVALQQTAIAVAAILDASLELAAITGHTTPQCLRLGFDVDAELPIVLFQTTNARRTGGLLGSYLVDVELYAIAADTQVATDLLAAASDVLTPVAFAGEGLDAVPDDSAASNSEPLDPEDVPFPEAVGVATTLTLAVFLPS